jgi:hypothetical protein
MKKEDKKDEYCLYVSGRLIEDLTEDLGSTVKPLFRVMAEVIRVSDEESKSDVTMERLWVNRLPERMEVFMYEEPNKHIKKLYLLENKDGANRLLLTMSLRGILF